MLTITGARESNAIPKACVRPGSAMTMTTMESRRAAHQMNAHPPRSITLADALALNVNTTANAEA